MRNPALFFAATAITSAALLATAPVVAESANAPYVPKVTLTKMGNPVLGDPAAPTKIVEYLSYACPTCAYFHTHDYRSLRDGRMVKGAASLEIRPIAHDIVGLTAAMAVGCSTPGRFYRTHALFLDTQSTWLTKVHNAPEAIMKTFGTGSAQTRVRAVARYAGFYTMMAERGTTEAQLNACFDNKAAFDRITQNAELLAKATNGQPTPTFLIDGALAGGTGRMEKLLPSLPALRD